MMNSPRLRWDIGTAYDFFISLEILHQPAEHGLRAAWAAGMRSRLPNSEQELLKNIYTNNIMGPPLHWIATGLAAPGDAAAALQALAEIPPADRLVTLFHNGEIDPAYLAGLVNIRDRGAWDESDYQAVSEHLRKHGKKYTRRQIAMGLDYWADAAGFGEAYLSALHSYYDVFFAEEELRLKPYLDRALAQAQDLAKGLSFAALLEELSQGVRFAEPPQAAEIILVPSFWSSPLIFFMQVRDQDAMVMTFGARPPDASLVPGEVVPDALLNALKAMADPTRLRIMRYLMSESLTPTQLARRLRLRPPTVIHHLSMMRVAGLVQVVVSKKEKMYKLRMETVTRMMDVLSDYLEHGEAEISPELEAFAAGPD